MYKQYFWQRRKPVWLLLLIFYSFIIIFDCVTSIFYDASGASNYFPKVERILLSLFFAPILETIMFQVIPIELLQAISKRLLKKRLPIFAIAISSIFFGLAHDYNWGYIFSTTVIGLVLSLCYWLFSIRESWRFGFAMTALLHFMINLTAEILECFTTTP